MARFDRVGEVLLGNDGQPLIKGLLDFFLSGSTDEADRITTFANPGQTIENTNPVVLSSAGRTPPIFFDGEANVVLRTAAGVQVQSKGTFPSLASAGTAFASWDALVTYDEKEIVIGSDTRYYLSIASNNLGNDPTSTSGSWQEIRFTDVYDAAETYEIGRIAIATDSNLYVSRVNANLNNEPSVSPTEWRLLTLDTDSPVFTTPEINDTSADHQYKFTVNELAADRNINLPLLLANDVFVFESHIQTLAGKTLTLPKINDTSADHTYDILVSELAANRTITLPLLAANDIFIFNDHAAIFTNKTFDLTDNTLIGTSAELAAAITDETGSGLLVFGTAPAFDGSVTFADQITLSGTGSFAKGLLFGAGGATGIYELSASNLAIDVANSCSFKVGSGTRYTWDGIAFQSGTGTGSFFLTRVAGTLSSVTYGFTGDIDTGVNRSGPDALDVVTGGVAAINVNSSQNVTVSVGDLIMGTSGKGVDFAAAGGNNFNQYKATSFTPTLRTDGVDFDSITYTVQVGFHVEQPDCDLYWGEITVNAITPGAATGSVAVGSLPVTSQNTVNLFGSLEIGFDDSWASATKHPQTGYVQTNNTFAYVVTNSGVDARSPLAVFLNAADVSAGARIRFSGRIPK